MFNWLNITKTEDMIAITLLAFFVISLWALYKIELHKEKKQHGKRMIKD